MCSKNQLNAKASSSESDLQLRLGRLASYFDHTYSNIFITFVSISRLDTVPAVLASAQVQVGAAKLITNDTQLLTHTNTDTFTLAPFALFFKSVALQVPPPPPTLVLVRHSSLPKDSMDSSWHGALITLAPDR